MGIRKPWQTNEPFELVLENVDGRPVEIDTEILDEVVTLLQRAIERAASYIVDFSDGFEKRQPDGWLELEIVELRKGSLIVRLRAWLRDPETETELANLASSRDLVFGTAEMLLKLAVSATAFVWAIEGITESVSDGSVNGAELDQEVIEHLKNDVEFRDMSEELQERLDHLGSDVATIKAPGNSPARFAPWTGTPAFPGAMVDAITAPVELVDVRIEVLSSTSVLAYDGEKIAAFVVKVTPTETTDWSRFAGRPSIIAISRMEPNAINAAEFGRTVTGRLEPIDPELIRPTMFREYRMNQSLYRFAHGLLAVASDERDADPGSRTGPPGQ